MKNNTAKTLFKENYFLQEFIDFQDFPGPALIFQDFPVLGNARIKFQDFSEFPGPVRSLKQTPFRTNPISDHLP